MELTIKERILLPGILPEESDKMTQIICDEILKKVTFSVKEIEKFKIETVPAGYKWGSEFDSETFKIELSESEATVLKDQSKRLDSEKRISRQILSLIKKIDSL